MKKWHLLMGVGVIVAIVGVLSASTRGAVAQDGEGDNVTYTWVGDVNAPDFPAGMDWINVAAPLSINDLRGKIVLLDFWTYGCINCIHVIPDLKRLEAEYPDELVVVGVHSAKFDNEGETRNIRYIVQRYEITHPVINDHDFVIWQSYGVRAWPTFMLIDPFGKVVGQLSGEPLYDRIAPIIDTMAHEYGAAGVLNLEPLAALQPEPAGLEETALRFPGKVLADAVGNRLFISDSNHNRVVVAALDTYTVLDVIGTGAAGFADGSYETAQFFRPQGLALDGQWLYVADTENHALRMVDLGSRTVTTIAGTGQQGFNRSESGPGTTTALSSPWDAVTVGDRVYIAMAGTHQLWVYDINSGEVGPYAGSGREALVDGPLMQAAMNQPSGIDSDGAVLYFADPEASAIRAADLDPAGEVRTIVGTGLFDFGDVDGVGDEVRLQHALGVTTADDGYLYVADTYNNKIKRIDPQTRASNTYLGTGEEGLADGETPLFYEPGGIDYADGKLYIADTNNHVIRVVDMSSKTVHTVEFTNVEQLINFSETETVPDSLFGTQDHVIALLPQTVGTGEGILQLDMMIPAGYKLNQVAPSTAVWTESPVVQIPAESRTVQILYPNVPLDVPVTFIAGQTELALDLTVYWCEGINETFCFVERARLVLPLTVAAGSNNHRVTFKHTLVPPTVENTLG